MLGCACLTDVSLLSKSDLNDARLSFIKTVGSTISPTAEMFAASAVDLISSRAAKLKVYSVTQCVCDLSVEKQSGTEQTARSTATDFDSFVFFANECEKEKKTRRQFFKPGCFYLPGLDAKP